MIIFTKSARLQKTEDLTCNHPEIVQEALKIRDANGKLLFQYASHLIEFISIPFSQWSSYAGINTLTKLPTGKYVKTLVRPCRTDVDINKIKSDLLSELHALKNLISNVSSNSLNHVIALKGLKVSFKNLLNLDLKKHPQEIAFYDINPPIFTHETTAVIFSCTPESDHNSAFVVSQRSNKFY